MFPPKAEIVRRLGSVILELMEERFSDLKEELLNELDESGAWRELVKKVLDGIFAELEAVFAENNSVLSADRSAEDDELLEPKVEITENVSSASDDDVTELMEDTGPDKSKTESSGEASEDSNGDRRLKPSSKTSREDVTLSRKRISCRQCGKRFIGDGSHVCEKPHSCDRCAKSFTYRYLLRLHQLRCSLSDGERKSEDKKQVRGFACKKCSKTLPRNLEHVCERPHICETCGKAYPYRHLLKVHMRVHSVKKEFQCEYCGKEFRAQPTLIKHRTIHLDLRPYPCAICHKAFRQKSALDVHTRTHTGEKPYMCSLCGKNFQRSGHLSRHMSMHRGEKPHECDICGFRCSQKGDLKRHVNRHGSTSDRGLVTLVPVVHTEGVTGVPLPPMSALKDDSLYEPIMVPTS